MQGLEKAGNGKCREVAYRNVNGAGGIGGTGAKEEAINVTFTSVFTDVYINIAETCCSSLIS